MIEGPEADHASSDEEEKEGPPEEVAKPKPKTDKPWLHVRPMNLNPQVKVNMKEKPKPWEKKKQKR